MLEACPEFSPSTVFWNESPRTFAPSPGLITGINVPGGPGVRVDTAAFAGSFVPPISLSSGESVHDEEKEDDFPGDALHRRIAGAIFGLQGFLVH
jgi:hypothetical protein